MNLEQVANTPTGEVVSVRDFLNHLFSGTAGFFDLTFIHPDPYHERHIINTSYRLGHEAPDWNYALDLNRRGYGVYYGLCAKNYKPADYQRSNEQAAGWLSCLWADIDLRDNLFTTKDDAYRALCDFSHPATVIIDSGGGLHGIWRIDPIRVTPDNTPIIKETLRGIALALHADTACAELARVFRLPGSINTKPDRNNARCEIIGWLPGEYEFESFTGYRLLAQPVHTETKREFKPIKPDDTPGYVAWYLDNGHAQGERNKALYWTGCRLYADGYSEREAVGMLLPRALADGLGEAEALRTIASAFKSKGGVPSYISKSARLRMRGGDALNKRSGGLS